MKGIDCLVELRRTTVMKNISIVMCSTSMQKVAAVELVHKGADFTFQKPITSLNIQIS
jgi:hypothetical protein